MTALANENGAVPPQDDAVNALAGTRVAALQYLERGWNIFPLRPGLKKPSIDWDGLSWVKGPAEADREDFAARWWSRDANLAIATGERSGVWVLDIDVNQDKGGLETMAALVAEHGPLPETFTVRTRAGGWHYFFTMPDFDLRNSESHIGPGLDVRANGGYVVAAPSFVDADDKGPAGHYTIVKDVPPVAAPEWLVALAHKERKVASAPTVSGDAPAYDAMPQDAQQRVLAYVQGAVAREADRLRAMKDAATPNGSGYQGKPWNATTHAVCCNLAELVLADWAPFDKDAAAEVLKANAPTDGGFTMTAVAEMFARLLGDKQPRPMPADLQPGTSFDDLTAGVPALGQAPKAVAEFKVVTPESETYTFSSGEALQADIAHKFATYELGVSTLYVGGLGWHRWDGKRFAPISDDAILKTLSAWVSSELRPMQMEFNAKTKSQAGYSDTPEGRHLAGMIKGYSNILNHTGTAKGTIEWARARVRHDAQEFDADPHLLNVQNGIVDLRTGDLGPHNPLKMMTKIAAVNYVAGKQHPDWTAALQALPGDEVRNYMQVVFGQATTGSKPDDDRARILEGGGANGKSTIVTPLMKALGSYATVASDKILLSAGNEHTTDLTDLKGVRLALLEELPETGGAKPTINVARLKKMLGTERMKARRMRQDNIEWQVSHTLLITTNYMIAISDTDHGTWRRLCRVVFPFRFTTHPIAEMDIAADPGLRDRVADGRQGQHEAVLAWAVEGAMRWYANGGGVHGRMPEMPLRVQEDTEEWRQRQDVIFEFLKAGIVEFKPGSYVMSTELHTAFQQMTMAEMPINTFVSRFAAHGLVQENRVTSARRKTGNLNLSRPEVSPGLPPPSQTTVWAGMAFTDAHRSAAMFGMGSAS